MSKRNKPVLVFAACLVLLIAGQGAVFATSFEFYGEPVYMSRSTDYSVKINGTPVDVISDINGYDYCHFSMWGGSASIEVTVNGLSTIEAYTIAPQRDAIPATVSGNKITYTIPYDKYTILWVRYKGAKLIVAADPQVANKPAASGTGIFNVVSQYGADNAGNNWATTAIQNAINDASNYNGGTVFVPAGRYKVGNLQLKSNIKLYMDGGSAFWFSGNQGDYTLDWTGKGNGTRWIENDLGAHDIKIYGRGTFDGNALGSNNFNNNILALASGYNFEVDGIIIRNGSKWGTIVNRSNNVTFNNVKFFQNMSGVGEDDGIDILESQDVTIKYSIACSFDDPFSIKTYDYEEPYITWPGGSHENAENITIDNVIAWTGCHAFKIGQGVGQLQRNITFKNSVVYDAAHAISLHHKTGAARADNITWDNIDIEKTGASNLGQSWFYVYIEDNGANVGPVSNLFIKNIHIRAAQSMGSDYGVLRGNDPVNLVNGVTFENIRLPNGSYAQTLEDMNIRNTAYYSNITIQGQGSSTPQIHINNIDTRTIENLKVTAEFTIDGALYGDWSTVGTFDRTFTNGVTGQNATWNGQKYVGNLVYSISSGSGSKILHILKEDTRTMANFKIYVEFTINGVLHYDYQTIGTFDSEINLTLDGHGGYWNGTAQRWEGNFIK